MHCLNLYDSSPNRGKTCAELGLSPEESCRYCRMERNYPLDGRKETHPRWMAKIVAELDPFQNAAPCWHPDSFIHVTISYYNCD